ncbi:hypothetical protein NP233_g1976 [Leucocoprinus birnbaumii]|uniref:Uncharacterized protein n=1 Tax=Leucocoprinus birnbaumii TaxID=56174 RepID=A0AAD5W1K9_9AGAR|nr:hypothetical protein NP233_g1976 [Leucocoprinus birnbaumii]
MKNTATFWLNDLSMAIASVLITITEVWRIWALWTGSRYAPYVITVYSLFYLAYIGVFIATLVLALDNHGVHSNDVTRILNAAVKPALKASLILIGFCLIAGRIFVIRRRLTRLMNGTLSQPLINYTGMIAMFTESYGLSVIMSVGLIISCAPPLVGDPPSVVILSIINYTDIISYYLLLYRILGGGAWSKNKAQELTSLNLVDESVNLPSLMVETPRERVMARSLPNYSPTV